jgi:TolB-like protein
MSRLATFIHELQQRRVFRIASIYVVTMWIIVQGALDLFPVFGIPNWAARLLVIVAVLGLPVAIVLAWAFQVTPDGIVRDRDHPADVTSSSGFRFDFVIIAAVLVLGAFLLIRANFDLITSEPGPEPVAAVVNTAPPNSIAVLPFANFSDDANAGYFGDGLSEELLNVLASIRGLNVASRTSAFSFKNSDADIQTIAAKLNVAYVLEGSVRKSDNQIRVTAQLIDARNDVHEWSETFDREFSEVFVIQDEIAGAIVTRLRPTVMAARGGGNNMPKRKPPTTNLEAYELYLRALPLVHSADARDVSAGSELLEQALEMDPAFETARNQLGALGDGEQDQGEEVTTED